MAVVVGECSPSLPGRSSVVLQSVTTSPVLHFSSLAPAAARRRTSVDSVEVRQSPMSTPLTVPATPELFRHRTDPPLLSSRRPSAVPASPVWQPLTSSLRVVSPRLGPAAMPQAAVPVRQLELRPASVPPPGASPVLTAAPSGSPVLTAAKQPGATQSWVRSPVVRAVASPSVQAALAPGACHGQRRPRWASLSEQELDWCLPESALTASTGGSSSHASTGGGGTGGAASNAAQTPISALLASVQPATAASTAPVDTVATAAPTAPAAAPPSSPTLGPAPAPAVVPATAVAGVSLAVDAGSRGGWSSLAEEVPSHKVTAIATLTAGPIQAYPAPSSGPGPARRRWASISDDDASPALWPMRSPGLRARRSHSSTPCIGPAAHQGTGTSLATVVEPAPFMLPMAHPATSTMADPAVLAAWGGLYGTGMASAPQPTVPAWTRTWGPCAPAPGAWVPAGGYPTHPAVFQPQLLQQPLPTAHGPTPTVSGQGVIAAAMATHGTERGSRTLNGWTVVWVGERAFRATADMKEQIEVIGFLVKVYRSYDKCCRAFDKKPNIPPQNAFVLSGAEATPMLQYLCRRGATDLRIVVDAEASSLAEAQQLCSGLPHPQDSAVTFAHSWDEVLAALNVLNMEASVRLPPPSDARPAAEMAEAKEEPLVPLGEDTMAHSSEVTPVAGSCAASDAPWTLVWISDQAFKPAATPLKAQLENLGCQVKGYKTHKNAARALDKKRALVRTVVLVSGTEAAPFLAYLASRPEISSTRVVVEACARAASVCESPTCQVVEGFDAAVQAVRRVAADPGFT